MDIGKFSIGKRMYGTNKFRWFYRPLFKETMKREGIRFFYWIGYNWYITMRK